MHLLLFYTISGIFVFLTMPYYHNIFFLFFHQISVLSIFIYLFILYVIISSFFPTFPILLLLLSLLYYLMHLFYLQEFLLDSHQPLHIHLSFTVLTQLNPGTVSPKREKLFYICSLSARIECEPEGEHSTHSDRVTNIGYFLFLGASLPACGNPELFYSNTLCKVSRFINIKSSCNAYIISH